MEAALAIQMACTHAATMSVLARLGGGHGTERRVAALGSAAARLLRAYSAQVEAFRRLRHGGQQHVRVEHVHINDGGQAIIGNATPARSGASGSPEHSAGGGESPTDPARAETTSRGFQKPWMKSLGPSFTLHGPAKQIADNPEVATAYLGM
jgi:hypothetical protein